VLVYSGKNRAITEPNASWPFDFAYRPHHARGPALAPRFVCRASPSTRKSPVASFLRKISIMPWRALAPKVSEVVTVWACG
jgi:hypothetical protein